MCCPKCRAEFRRGFEMCADCGVPLVWELPPEPEPRAVEWVTVVESRDEGLLAVIESLLHGAGIPFVVTGRRHMTRYGHLLGPAEVKVARRDAREAVLLLQPLFEDGSGDGE